jgi:hypothetical protein
MMPIPFGVDGICLHLKRRGKTPQIIVNSEMNERRIRFTLAHELGHVLIPWHLGSIADEIDVSEYGDFDYRIKEGEANRFASELLMPFDWVRKIVGKSENPHESVRTIAADAQVSLLASALRVTQIHPLACILAVIEDGRVSLSSRSSHALANQPPIGARIDPDTLFPWTKNHWHQLEGTMEYPWWTFPGDAPLPTAPNNTWRDILDDIIREIDVPESKIKWFKDSLNGTIAYANGRVREHRTQEKIYDACLQRLHSAARSDTLYHRLIKNDKFEAFLSLRVRALFDAA